MAGDRSAAAPNRSRGQQSGRLEGIFQPLTAGRHDGGYHRAIRDESTARTRPRAKNEKRYKIDLIITSPAIYMWK